jgi:hypothetical protein
VQVYRWLGDFDALTIRADRQEALIVVRLADWIELLKAADSEDAA